MHAQHRLRHGGSMRRSAVAAGVFALLAPAAVRAQLQLDLTLDPTSPLVGQPVGATYRLTNKGAKAHTADLCLDHPCGLLDLAITDPSGATRLFASRSMNLGRMERRPPRTRTLAPGESVEGRGCVVFDENTQDFAFPSAGNYGATSTFHSDLGPIASATVTLTVAAPSGVDAAALDFVRKNGLGPYLCASEAPYYPMDDKTAGALDSLASKYGKTVYGEAADRTLRELGLRGIRAFPSEVNFGRAPVGATAAYRIQLRNSGMQPAQILNFGALAAPFSAGTTPTTPVTLDGGTYVEVEPTLAPAAAGTVSTTWRIETSVGEVVLTLQGEGVTSPRLRFSLDKVDFGRVTPGSTGRATFQVTNVGLEDLVIDGFSPLRGPFSYGALPALPLTLAKGGAIDVEVKFGAEAGSFEGSVLLRSNDPWTPTARLDLFAVGAGAQDGGCGCRVGGRDAGAAVTVFALVALALALGARARSARRRVRRGR